MDWTLIVALVGLLGFAGVILSLISLTRAQRQQARVGDQDLPPRTPLETGIQDTAIQSLSSRLAAIEGRIGTIAATLESVHVLQQRVAAIETNMPALQEAYEKYADSISRADKRDTERQRRSDKLMGPTAGEAAAALSGAVDVAPTEAAPQNNDGKRVGILGHGGRSR